MGKPMATDSTKLQGELNEKPEAQDLDVERLLAGFLRALLDEQRQWSSSPAPKETAGSLEGAQRTSS